MDINLKNVGIISDSTVKIDGLTVITGKNNSGKTTVGKALYAIVQAHSDIEYYYDMAICNYLKAQFFNIWRALVGNQWRYIRLNDGNISSEGNDAILMYLCNRLYSNGSSDDLRGMLDKVGNLLSELTFDKFERFLNRYCIYIGEVDGFFSAIVENFDLCIKDAIKIYERTDMTISDKNGFRLFRREQVKRYLNDGFKNQVIPVMATSREAEIYISVANKKKIDVTVHNKEEIELSDDSPYVLPYYKGIFIDDPFILDRMDHEEQYREFLMYKQDDTTVKPVDVLSYRDHLKKLLMYTGNAGFFDNLEFQRQYQGIIEKINSIVPGEFQMTKDGFFYVNEEARLDVHNMATGSKLFFIIKQLFTKGLLDDKTIVILDEPESHLHPEWINKLAEILVLIIKEIGVHILITTHSPNLLLALKVFANKYGDLGNAHFYLARNKEKSWEAEIVSIDDNIDEGYAHLSIPLIEMSLEQDKITGGEDGN